MTHEEAFQATDFNYQGMTKGVFRFSYRKFKNGMVRPSFTQDLTHKMEPNGPMIVGFHGLRMKVLRATNRKSVYVVEKKINWRLRQRKQGGLRIFGKKSDAWEATTCTRSRLWVCGV